MCVCLVYLSKALGPCVFIAVLFCCLALVSLKKLKGTYKRLAGL